MDLDRTEGTIMNPARPRLESRDARPSRPGRVAAPASKAGLTLLIAAFSILGATPRASAQPGGALKEVGFDQNLNAQIPLTLKFRDEVGGDVQLSDYFGKRPVILVMGYSNCPLLCSQVLGEVTRSLKPLDFSIGKDFDVVTVSINPKETPEQADSMRRNYLKRYNRPGSEPGWHALTGDEPSIQRLAKAVGFRYTYSPKLDLYAHASGFVLLTPAGRISRYFYGIEFPARELKYALIEASASRIGSPIDKLVLYCYDFDPATGKYTFAVMSAIRVLGVATALALGTFMFVMVRRDRRMARATRASTPDFPPGPAIP
jgi:protein SCO1